MRRGVGRAAIGRRVQSSQQQREHGNTIKRAHADELKTQLSVFQAALSNFARTHAADIRSNPQFRNEFAKMCTAIGVDPLASSSNKKGNFWAEVLGGTVNDFYFELAVKVVEVCRRTRPQNGGLIAVAEIRDSIIRQDESTGGGMDLSEEDIFRAVKSLQPLGSGFDILSIGSKKIIRSVPQELSKDQATVLEVLQNIGFVTRRLLQDNLSWEPSRAQTVIDDLTAESVLWVDGQAEEDEYWALGFR